MMLRDYRRRSLGEEKQSESLETQDGVNETFVKTILPTMIGAPVSWDERVPYVDDNISGGDFTGRAGFAQLQSEAVKGDVVVVRDQSRLGRDALEIALALRELIMNRGVRLFYAADRREVPYKTALDMLMIVLNGYSDQAQLETIRAKTKEALRARAQNGFASGSKCYGYRWELHASGKKIAALVEREAAAVVAIFTWYASGLKLHEIADRLNAEPERYPAPDAGKRSIGRWRYFSVRRILGNERYRGVYTHGANAWKRVGKSKKRAPITEAPVRHEDPGLRLVSDDVWYAAARRLKTAADSAAPKQSNAVKAPLSGIARCGRCGGPVVIRKYKVNGGHAEAYICGSSHWHGKDHCAGLSQQPADDAHAAVAAVIQQQVLASDVVDQILEQVRIGMEEQIRLAQKDAKPLEAELKKLQKEQGNLADAIAAGGGVLSVPELLDGLAKRRERIKQLEGEIAAAGRSPTQTRAQVSQAIKFARETMANLSAVLMQPGTLREVTQALIPEGITFAEVPDPQDPEKTVWEGRASASLHVIFGTCPSEAFPNMTIPLVFRLPSRRRRPARRPALTPVPAPM